MNKIPVWFDTDIGVDDAVAFLVLHRQPELEVVGISAVSGNVGLEHTYPNARNICHLVGARYPVYKGADRPLYAEVEHASYVHGEEGLGGARLESSPAPHESEAAWDALYRAAVEYGGELQVLAVGPLTNIAIALAKYPTLKTLIKRLLIMGGGAARGNTTPAAEFNIYADPEAAQLVFKSGIPIVMCGLDVTLQGYLTAEEIEEIGNYALLINVADKGTFVGKKAELVFTDGTSKVVTTEKDYSKADNLKYDVNKDGKFTEADNTAWSTTAGVADGQKEPVIVTYKVDNDGVYTLKAVDVAKSSYKVASTALNLKNDKASISVDKCTVNDVKDTTYVTANSATQFVVADAGSNEDFTAYTGIKNAPTIAAGKNEGYKTDVFFYCKNGKMVTVMFVLPQSKVAIEDDNNKMIFFAKESGSDLEHDKDSNYFEYNAIVDGKITTVKVADKAGAEDKAGYYSHYTVDKDGYVSSTNDYTKVQFTRNYTG